MAAEPVEKQPIKFTPRAELAAAIAAGGSVLARFPDGRGVHATKPEHLPSDADFALASGNKASVAEVDLDIDEQIARLQKQKAALVAAKKANAPEPEKPATVAPEPEKLVEPPKVEVKADDPKAPVKGK